MGKGIAIVQHRVSTDPIFCVFSSPDDGFCEKSQCLYLKMRKKYGKHNEPLGYHNKCDLFKVWLDQEFHPYPIRCQQCKQACGE